jgi:hypothetical protein
MKYLLMLTFLNCQVGEVEIKKLEIASVHPSIMGAVRALDYQARKHKHCKSYEFSISGKSSEDD